MKIYTKKGDNGKTELLGGTIVSKNHKRLECYGSIDELNALIGNIYDQKISNQHKEILFNIQNQLFNIGSIISFDGRKKKIILPEIYEENIVTLEKEIDRMDSYLPKLKAFILPCGHSTSSKCHIARTVCRRAERNLISLSHTNKVNPILLKYLNRLSDYLFVLARDILFSSKSKEIIWEKNQKKTS